MKKQTLLLLVVGNLCMSFTLLTQNLFTVPEGPADFLKGLGITLTISALFVQLKLERKAGER